MIETIRTHLNESDRAVSPVIGVILMVAITVILAAVIGTFVLGLGGDLQDNAPSATVTIQDHPDAFNEDGDGENMFRINHRSGDEIPAEELRIVIRNDSTGALVAEWQGGEWTNPAYLGLSDGDAATTDLLNGDTVLQTGDFIGTGDRITIISGDQGTNVRYEEDERYEISLIHVDTDQQIAGATVRLR